VHCKRERHHVYVGRTRGMPAAKWGNPFVVGKHGTREGCIALCRPRVENDTAGIVAATGEDNQVTVATQAPMTKKVTLDRSEPRPGAGAIPPTGPGTGPTTQTLETTLQGATVQMRAGHG
jgi:Domain of unknown function (DUF4326)